MEKQINELEQVIEKIDNISGVVNREIEVVKLLRLIAIEQAKIIDLLNK